MLLLTEFWFDENQYYRTHPFERHSKPLQRLREFVWNGMTVADKLFDTSATTKYQYGGVKDKKFREHINGCSFHVRENILIPNDCESGKKNVGDLNSRTNPRSCYENNPAKLEKRRKTKKRTHDLQKLRRTEAQKRWFSTYRKLYYQASAYSKVEFENHVEVGEHNVGKLVRLCMNAKCTALGGLSVMEYAKTIGGVYIFFTKNTGKIRIKQESIRFLTSGQKKVGNGNHNAVLMRRNPEVICPHFTNKYCPYEDRMKYKFLKLSEADCDNRGIKYFPLVEGLMTAYQGRLLEKHCQILLNPLKLGQRLHRVCGAGSGNPNNVNIIPITIGVTFLPGRFYKKNGDIVIVGSRDGTDGY